MATLSTNPEHKAGPTFSLVSILSIVAALLSFHFNAAAGFLMAIVAIVLGAIGFIIALLPGTRGGILSVVSIIAGAIGVIAAFVKLLGGHVL